MAASPVTGNPGRRPARIPFGWMSNEAIQATLQAARPGAAVDAADLEGVVSRQVAAAQRKRDATVAIVEGPFVPEVLAHIATLHASGAADQFFNEGWTVAMVDLTQVTALQPHVFVDRLDEVKQIARQGLGAVATLTLPLPSEEQLQVSCDPNAKSWTVVSPSPNLKVVGAHSGPVNPQPGSPPAFGFVAATLPSYLQVAHVGDSYVLRDGYHRAVGLITAGMSIVPGFVRDFDSAGAVLAGLPPGMLPAATWLAPNAPRLPDYLDDAVSATVELPAMRRAIVITAVELTIPAA